MAEKESKDIDMQSQTKLEQFSILLEKEMGKYNLLPDPSKFKSVEEYAASVIKIKNTIISALFSKFLYIEDMENKNMIMIGAKLPELAEIALKNDTNKVTFISKDEIEEIELMTKSELSDLILRKLIKIKEAK